MDQSKPSAPNYAQQARDFTAFHTFGVLSTISVGQAGFPFGSLTPYLLTAAGELVVYISLIAEHYKNLTRDPKGSITVLDSFGAHDPQAHARACLLAEFSSVSEADQAPIQSEYERRFPKSINYEIAHNFRFFRGQVTRVRWIGGFGEIGWVPGEKFAAAVPDPVTAAGWDIVSHMNEDHADALKDLVRGFSQVDPGAKQVVMTGITRNDFTISVRGHGRADTVMIPFANPLAAPGDSRAAIIALLKQAREKLKGA